jgi:NTE family protein
MPCVAGRLARGVCANKPIEQLRRRLVVGATRRDDKRPVFFSPGNADVAVLASSALPGILSPVGIEDVEYEDGDESMPLAVRAVRQVGARYVIAVDVTSRPETEPVDASPAQRERVASGGRAWRRRLRKRST